jgi:mRNA interferase MazF
MVNKDGYIPERGDLVWVNFNPQTGREQKNKRPALVLSPRIYNQKTSLALLCPVTSQVKKYPFEVLFGGSKISGAILSDQLRSLDWQARKVRFIEKAPADILKKVQKNILLLLND